MSISTTPRPDLEQIRAAFPALTNTSTILLENAGGSQVPAVVADSIRHYMLNSYVQLDANYELSRRCTSVVEEAHDFVNLLMNGQGVGQVVLGPSMTSLANMLGHCYAKRLKAGDEIIVAESGHEANVGPWVKLAEQGFTVRMWPFDPEGLGCHLESLQELLNDRTRIVALPHVSNLLGEIIDVNAITKAAHEAGARVVVDGVAFAPHRAIDVRQWGVDWYAFSTYKVYGPHMAAFFGTDEAWADLVGSGPNHFFIPEDEIPYKFQPGGVSHEACAGILALGEYLRFLAGRPPGASMDRQTINDAFGLMEACEQPPTARLIDWLNQRSDLRIIGPNHAQANRVGTISFLHDHKSSASIADHVGARGIGIRNGHMYAIRICQRLGLRDVEDGVVRVSLVHYNTMEEIDLLIDALDEAMGS